jgi:hypothetical protein
LPGSLRPATQQGRESAYRPPLARGLRRRSPSLSPRPRRRRSVLSEIPDFKYAAAGQDLLPEPASGADLGRPEGSHTRARSLGTPARSRSRGSPPRAGVSGNPVRRSPPDHSPPDSLTHAPTTEPLSWFRAVVSAPSRLAPRLGGPRGPASVLQPDHLSLNPGCVRAGASTGPSKLTASTRRLSPGTGSGRFA